VFSDTNNNQIVAYDPATQQWPRVLQGFFQTQLEWSPDGSQLAALTEGADPYDMRLVVIQRSGWTVRDVPTTLKGEKQVYGWLDDHTLAVNVPEVSFKGTPPAWAATELHPGIYRIDVATGKSESLTSRPANPFAANLSSDGTQFIYYDNNFNLTVAAADGSQTHSVGHTGNTPTWSPDGQWILFRTNYNDDKNFPSPTVTTLYMVHPDGSVTEKVLATTATTFETAWSPDEQTILISEYEGPEPGSYTLSIFDVKTATLKKLDLPSMTGSMVLNLLGWQP
jgi:Tol biopolymer transport system component